MGLLFILPYISSCFFLSRFFRQRYLHSCVRQKLQIWYTDSQQQLVSWNRKWAFSYLFVPIFVLFSFSPDISSKIFPQPFKIETLNLVYRFTRTSFTLESKMGLLLFVRPYICSFFFLSRYFVKDIPTTV